MIFSYVEQRCSINTFVYFLLLSIKQEQIQTFSFIFSIKIAARLNLKLTGSERRKSFHSYVVLKRI